MKAIIIDDELAARQNLIQLLNHYCPEITITGQFGRPSLVVNYLKTNEAPDCIFLDIEMPEMNGFELLQKIDLTQVKVIFVTAHLTYSLRALKANALDYVLKPIHVNELKNAVQKLHEHEQMLKKLVNRVIYKKSIQNMIQSIQSGSNRKITIPHTNGLKILNTEELVEIKAEGAYCRLILVNKKNLIVSKNLKYFEEILDETNFIRIHYSYIINLNHLSEFSSLDGGTVVLTNGRKRLVAKRRIKPFKNKLSEYFS